MVFIVACYRALCITEHSVQTENCTLRSTIWNVPLYGAQYIYVLPSTNSEVFDSRQLLRAVLRYGVRGLSQAVAAATAATVLRMYSMYAPSIYGLRYCTRRIAGHSLHTYMYSRYSMGQGNTGG